MYMYSIVLSIVFITLYNSIMCLYIIYTYKWSDTKTHLCKTLVLISGTIRSSTSRSNDAANWFQQRIRIPLSCSQSATASAYAPPREN